jgi:hypothetical protein
MNYDKYTPKSQYPATIYKPHLPKEDRFNPTKVKEYAAKVEEFNAAMVEWNEKRDAWREERIELDEQFKKDALDECGILNHPKAEKAYSLAYQDGHSEGFHGIYNALSKYAELLTD